MTQLSSPNISPTDQAQLRSALARMLSANDVLEDAINDVADDLDALEGVIGSITVNFQDTVVAGEPVYIAANGEAAEADASSRFLANVAGLSAAAVTAGNQGTVVTSGRLTLADWSTVTGEVALEPGRDYFLSTTGGMLTTEAPEADNEVVCRVGKAISTTVFEVTISQIVLL